MCQSRQRQAGDTADHPAETENEVTPEMIEVGREAFREWIDRAENYTAIQDGAYGNDEDLVREIVSAIRKSDQTPPASGL